MKFIIIHNFSEAVDPEQRKLRLQKLARYATTHGHRVQHLRSKMAKTLSGVSKPGTSSGMRSVLLKRHVKLGKQVKPHERRHFIAKDVVSKFRSPKGSPERKSRSAAIKHTRWALR